MSSTNPTNAQTGAQVSAQPSAQPGEHERPIQPVSVDALILAGGRASRLGGLDKASVIVGQARLVDRVIAAARRAGLGRVIVAGPPHTGQLADVVVREDPPFSGPVAALGAGLDQVQGQWLLLLGCDLVHPAAIIDQLLAAIPPTSASRPAAVVLQDEAGHPQWVASCLRTSALRRCLGDYSPGQLAHQSLRGIIGQLQPQFVATASATTADIDTPAQLAQARQTAELPVATSPASTDMSTPTDRPD